MERDSSLRAWRVVYLMFGTPERLSRTQSECVLSHTSCNVDLTPNAPNSTPHTVVGVLDKSFSNNGKLKVQAAPKRSVMLAPRCVPPC